MSRHRLKIVSFLAASAVLVLAACGNGGAPSAGGGETTPAGSGGSRTVNVKALDALRFEPSSVEVKAGETVKFVVTNAGTIEHEFVLGDEQIQQVHEGQMGMTGHMSMEAMAALAMKPGETKEATVTFDKAGQILFGCHITGHYGAGMKGTVTVV